MTTPTPTQAPKTGPAHHLWRLTSFATSPQARPALLGALGAVLITTGFPDSVSQREGVHDLACAVVRKPYTDEDILQAVKRCLNGTHAQPS